MNENQAQAEGPVGVGMIGLGTVGRGVAELMQNHAEVYAKRAGRPAELRAVVVRDLAKAQDWATESRAVDASILGTDIDAVLGDDIDVVIEVAGGVDVARRYVEAALGAGKHVVTANKALLAAHGPALFKLAKNNGVSVAFEASCAGGIPCVTALQFGLMSNAVRGLYGILNGTCNYILTQMTRHGQSYAEALQQAKELGYAEADETLDVSGADAAQKLAILASIAFGGAVPGDAVACEGIDTLDLLDVSFGEELGYDLKLIAAAEQETDGDGLFLSTRPCFVAKDAQLAQVHGAFNALSVVGDAVGHVMFYGPGAGKGPTASAVVSDLLNVASGWYPKAFAAMGLLPDGSVEAKRCASGDAVSRFYLRLALRDVPGGFGRITTTLGDHGVSLSAVLQHEAGEDESGTSGKFVPVVVTTHRCLQGDLAAACEALAALDEVEGSPVVIRILDFAG
ncbi:MAG: homoserine dehydrogenase [Planctomycetota bacterium]